MVVYPDSRVSILSIHGTYLSDSSDGTLTWNKKSVSRQELWQMTKFGNNKIALRGASGKYLSASPDGLVTCSKVDFKMYENEPKSKAILGICWRMGTV